MKNQAKRCWVAYTTTDSKERASLMARSLVEKQLVVCVNIVGPVESVYSWQGKVEQTTEWILMMKCSESQCEELKMALPRLHSYEVPELIMFPIADGHSAYLDWIAASGAGVGHE
ncbi:Divalent-cation tolerance protein CutA [Limnobacter sp. 130]|jgi:periplasmic divalent cation tolerance protein|uniref:divalent-cation tolerance protein CutA n=1 Tax=Limnobacter sp. 130 TaxID=2653147 RepID=UPI0012F2A214|nr:divalent-cation tolerance protein CutA [Limnobacter sp. 130]VWX34452.1 Divalent-cation tolerance protein CutA [Limnobacter sp. 130]